MCSFFLGLHVDFQVKTYLPYHGFGRKIQCGTQKIHLQWHIKKEYELHYFINNNILSIFSSFHPFIFNLFIFNPFIYRNSFQLLTFNSQLSDKHPRTLLVFGIVGLALQLPFLHQGHAYKTEQAGHQDGAEQAPALQRTTLRPLSSFMICSKWFSVRFLSVVRKDTNNL